MSWAISSSELQTYKQLAQTLVTELSALNTVAIAFNVRPITLLSDEVGFDIILPRQVFDNDPLRAINYLDKFSRLLRCFNELSTGSAKVPTLVYASTSDLIIGLGIAATAALPFLSFSSALIEAATKLVNFTKAIRELQALTRESKPDLEQEIRTAVETTVNSGIEEAVKLANSSLPSGRINELKVSISKDSNNVVDLIARGVRIGLTIESSEKLRQLKQVTVGTENFDVDEMLKKFTALEQKLESTIELLEDEDRLRIPVVKDDQIL